MVFTRYSLNKILLAFSFIIIISFYFSTPYISFDNKRLLLNKEIWLHVYGSMASFASTIVVYNTKYGVYIHADLITEIIGFKKNILDFITLEENQSTFFDSSEEARVIYQNYMDDLVKLQNQIRRFRQFIMDTSLEEEVFNQFLSSTIKIYIQYLESSKCVLNLAPNVEDTNVQDLLKLIDNFIDRLKNLF